MTRSTNPRDDMICTWCRGSVISTNKKTLPRFTKFPQLPTGTGVVVCGSRCKERPEGAPVGSEMAGVQA